MNWTLTLSIALSVLAGGVIAYTGFVIGVDRGQIHVLKMIDEMPNDKLTAFVDSLPIHTINRTKEAINRIYGKELH